MGGVARLLFVNISDEQLWIYSVPPFHAALRAGAGSFIARIMDFNGVPATATTNLLHELFARGLEVSTDGGQRLGVVSILRRWFSCCP